MRRPTTMWLVAIALLVARAMPVRAQADSSFAVLVSAGAGFGVNISQEILLPKGADNRGPNAMVRVLWKPDHRLRVGLEIGWMRCTSSEGPIRDSNGVPQEAAIHLDAVPLLLTFSMNFDRVNLSAGAGYYLMLSTLRGFGTASSTQWNYGISASAEYMAPVTPALRLGGGIGMYGITQLGQYLAAVQFRAEYRLLDW